jgi:hypothetical protein
LLGVVIHIVLGSLFALSCFGGGGFRLKDRPNCGRHFDLVAPQQTA